MDNLKKIFKSKPSKRLRLTSKNIKNWPSFEELITKGKIKFDKRGRLRYLHGAPVGDLILTRINKDGTPNYKESAEEWFDPESQKAKDFQWP